MYIADIDEVKRLIKDWKSDYQTSQASISSNDST